MGKGNIPAPSEDRPIVRVRKWVDLGELVVDGLQELAAADNRTLKSYMETVLITHFLDGGYTGPLAKAKNKLQKTK